jgi:hypothetical protein
LLLDNGGGISHLFRCPDRGAAKLEYDHLPLLSAVSNKKAGAFAPACRVVGLLLRTLRYSIHPTGVRIIIIPVIEIMVPSVVVVAI